MDPELTRLNKALEIYKNTLKKTEIGSDEWMYIGTCIDNLTQLIKKRKN